MMDRFARALYGVAAVLLLLGLLLRFAPVPAGASRVAEIPRPAPSTAGRTPGGEPAGATATIVAGNIFSASRAAPRVRYTPPDLAPARAPVARRAPPRMRLRLLGTVVGPAGTAALIDADPAVRGAEIYQVGAVVDGRRIVAVSESTVVLEGSAGRTVLRLQPTP